MALNSKVKDFKNIELGKKLSQTLLSVFSKELNDGTLIKNKEKILLEVLSRPIDPLTKNCVEILSKVKTNENFKRTIEDLQNYIKNSRKKTIEVSKELLLSKNTIMVLGYSKTIFEMIEKYGKHLTIYVPELGPDMNGRKMAKKLRNQTVLIPDSAIGYFIPSVDLVLSRSVCSTKNGFLSPSGTGAASILCKWYNKDFALVSELLRNGDAYVVSEFRWDVPYNNRAPINDLTPIKTINKIITEEGILTTKSYFNKAIQKKKEMMK